MKLKEAWTVFCNRLRFEQTNNAPVVEFSVLISNVE